MNLTVKRIIKTGVQIAGIVILEGTLSVVGQKLREVSRANYTTVKDDLKQVTNLTKNALNGADPDDWDLI